MSIRKPVESIAFLGMTCGFVSAAFIGDSTHAGREVALAGSVLVGSAFVAELLLRIRERRRRRELEGGDQSLLPSWSEVRTQTARRATDFREMLRIGAPPPAGGHPAELGAARPPAHDEQR